MTMIHIWSDYVCPFCLIADEIVGRAIDGRDDVQVVHHAFELRPHPTPTLRPEDEYLPDIWERAVYPMARRHGVELRLPSVSPQPYTEAAFRGAQLAAARGVGDAYHRRMLTAFFRDDLDIGRADVLADLAVEVGLDRDEYLAALASPDTAAAHRAHLATAAEQRITVVPTLVIGDRRINGVPSTEDVVEALAAARNEEAA